MAIIKNGKEYEYNIDGDLVPKGTVKIGSMYGDFENRYEPKKDSEFLIIATNKSSNRSKRSLERTVRRLLR